jgi:hypothetical protein
MSSKVASLTITEALDVLTSHNGPLRVLCPKQLSEAQAQALGRHRGTLDLRGAENLSTSVASHLAAHEGPLYLNDVRTLSRSSAEALLSHKGPLYLLEVSQVSDEVAEALAKHQDAAWIFPLAEMSDRARGLLKEHRERICKKMGLPVGRESAPLTGTFKPGPVDEKGGRSYIYYSRLAHSKAVPVRICCRSDRTEVADEQADELPDWFISQFTKLGECIEQCSKLPPGDRDPLYILDVAVLIDIDSKKLAFHGIVINVVDEDGEYWEVCVHGPSFPTEFHIDCWGGGHYQSADYLERLPLNHSIFDSTLEGLKWWQKNTVERAKDIRSQAASLHGLSDQERIDRIKERLAAIAADRTSKTFDLEIVPITDDELKALPQGLPKSHYELLRQVGAFSLGHNDCLVIEAFTPRPWEESDYCTPIREEDRIPNEQNYLYMARDIEGECYGYDITKEPFQIVSWDFAICRPEQRGYRSFLDLIEEHIFQEFLRPSSN